MFLNQQRFRAEGILIPNLHKALAVMCHYMRHLKIFILLFLLSCNSAKDPEAEVKNTDGSYKYDCVNNIFSDFVLMHSSLDKSRKPFLLTYGFKGDLINNTSDIYEKAFLKLHLILVLDNGTELNCDKTNYGKDLIGNGVFSTIEYNWIPKSKWKVNAIKTCTLSTDYFTYPVKEVFTQFYLELIDQVNNTHKEILLSQRDVTEKWKKAKLKFKENKTDCSDTQENEFIQNK